MDRYHSVINEHRLPKYSILVGVVKSPSEYQTRKKPGAVVPGPVPLLYFPYVRDSVVQMIAVQPAGPVIDVDKRVLRLAVLV